MDYKEIQKFYNYKIYLEILDNTINNYKRDILMKKTYLLLSNNLDDFYEYYNNYNKYYFQLVKYYNYYYKLFVLN
jgi:hypothetical protein